MVRIRGSALDASLLRVRWGRGVEWKESRARGARCEMGAAGTAGRREVKSPPTRRYRLLRERGEAESYGQQGGPEEICTEMVSQLTELYKFFRSERID